MGEIANFCKWTASFFELVLLHWKMKLIVLAVALFALAQAKPMPRSRDYYDVYIKAITDNFDRLFPETRHIRSIPEGEEETADAPAEEEKKKKTEDAPEEKKDEEAPAEEEKKDKEEKKDEDEDKK